MFSFSLIRNYISCNFNQIYTSLTPNKTSVTGWKTVNDQCKITKTNKFLWSKFAAKIKTLLNLSVYMQIWKYCMYKEKIETDIKTHYNFIIIKKYNTSIRINRYGNGHNKNSRINLKSIKK